MYNSKIATWAATNMDSGSKSRALRELPAFMDLSTGSINNHWHGRSKVRDTAAHKYVAYFKSLGYQVDFEDLFDSVAIPVHEPSHA